MGPVPHVLWLNPECGLQLFCDENLVMCKRWELCTVCTESRNKYDLFSYHTKGQQYGEGHRSMPLVGRTK